MDIILNFGVNKYQGINPVRGRGREECYCDGEKLGNRVDAALEIPMWVRRAHTHIQIVVDTPSFLIAHQ